MATAVSPLYAVEPKLGMDELPVLTQENQHSLASKRVFNYFTRSHYKVISADDALSEHIFDRYIRQLDYNKQFFLQADISALNINSKQFDDALKEGKLNFAYDIYVLNQQRRYERYHYALSLLDKPMDFTVANDAYNYDRKDADWAKNQAELNELWRQRVKYDALNLKLAGKESKDIKELLSKRYNAAIRRLTQAKSEDVFQLVMNAFARSVEAHTSYLSPRNAERFQMDMNLSLEGIGAVLFIEDDFTVIRSLVVGGPAEKSGKLKPEDKIVGVAQDGEDFVDVIGWRLDDVVELIKGAKGTKVRLQILKGDSADNQMSSVELVRDKIKLEDRAATSEVYTPKTGDYAGKKLGVIDIPSFYNNLTRDVKAEIEKLKKDSVDGIIVDLRGNGGGSLPESIMLTGLFIDVGPVVQVRTGVNKVDVQKDRDSGVSYEGPVAIMVDRYSASASEIFSAALQDYGRALVIGENTFGKGTVQQHKSLNKRFDFLDKPLGHIQYTFAKFYRINGGSTQNKGVQPDILFPTPIDPAEWGESKEENALPWDKIKRASYKKLTDVDALIPKLEQRHQARIKNDPEFSYILSDIEEYKAKKDEKVESLVEKERKDRRDELNKKRLVRANERLVRLNKEKITDLDDLPDELNELDPLLDEAANITFDYIKVINGQSLTALATKKDVEEKVN